MASDAAEAEGAPRRRRGRPARALGREGPGARERILLAAREEFAARGYDKTSVRGIGRTARVDPALVHHYFGSKEQVFAAAIELSFEPAAQVADLVSQSPEHAGERLARLFLGVWENPATKAPLLAVLRSAVTHEAAAAVLREVVLRTVLERVATNLDVPNPKLRAELAGAQMVGIAMLRYVIEVEPLATADASEIVELVAPNLQRYLTGP
ncbi:TetR/AcrR family transcriptional regulator [Streptomyces sp. TP-A0874]|uniref:TetR/AcrR family transcriptional regulator n=1 Tax=Streptomyces sp. TP-A0874 TaxID=549819 RepID=UPI000853D104|nr:TetR family transcriptional regulator [Streptomyces sp. TP-A0874]